MIAPFASYWAIKITYINFIKYLITLCNYSLQFLVCLFPLFSSLFFIKEIIIYLIISKVFSIKLRIYNSSNLLSTSI